MNTWSLLLVLGALRPEGPVCVGEPVSVLATRGEHPLAGQPLVEIQAPGAADATQRTVGTTDARGAVSWTPTRPGPVVLDVDGERATLYASAARLSDAAPALAIGLLLVGGWCAAGLALARGPRR